MKIAFVVQRYGIEINGGAELHCRWIAEHMQKHWQVEVLTTKALDYITWKNYFSETVEEVNGIKVRRFPVTKARDPERFGKLQNKILEREHKLSEELKWIEEEGPYSPQLIQFIQDHENDYDYFIFFSYRYYHSYWGIQTVPYKSILVPTAEHDSIIYLSLFKSVFRNLRAFIYNSVEERNMINRLARNDHILGDVVGVGTEIPPHKSVKNFREKYKVKEDYIIYIGRIDENKGCHELFDFFFQFKHETGSVLKLVLVGTTILKIPIHPDIIYLGFLPEEDKFAALEGALLLCMPSFYESLSMVTLEAWAMEKPVLANARCDVLKGQCIRSNAGLYYSDYHEFKEALCLLLNRLQLRETMGKNGHGYFQENYTWEIIENKYLSLVDHLKGEN